MSCSHLLFFSILHIHGRLAQALGLHAYLPIVLPSAFIDLLVLGTIVFAPYYSPKPTEDILLVGIVCAEHTTHSEFSLCPHSVSSRLGTSPSAKNPARSARLWWATHATSSDLRFRASLTILCQ